MDVIEVSIPCGRDVHRVRWQGGELSLADHGEPEASNAGRTGARATEPPGCDAVLDLWRHADFVQLYDYLLARREVTGRLQRDHEIASAIRARRIGKMLGRPLRPSPVEYPPRHPRLREKEEEHAARNLSYVLESLPEVLVRAFIATVGLTAQQTVDRQPPPSARGAIEGVLARASRSALLRCLRTVLEPDVSVEISVSAIATAAAPALHHHVDARGGKVDLFLRPRWLPDVWLASHDVVGDVFVLDVDEGRSGTGVRFELGRSGRIEARHVDVAL